jgi:Flp pilus assembly protein TadD
MKYGLLIATILIGALANAGFALDPKVFPGKGSKDAWTRACIIANEGHKIAKKSEESAIPKFQQAIAIYPYADCFYLDLGVSYENKMNPDLRKAEAAYRKATELDPKDWHNWNSLCRTLGQQEKYAASREAGLKALSCNPPPDKAAALKAIIADINNFLANSR